MKFLQDFEYNQYKLNYILPPSIVDPLDNIQDSTIESKGNIT